MNLLLGFTFTPAEELFAKLEGSHSAGATPVDRGVVRRSDLMKCMADAMVS
ncbi:hypothetical protein KHC23_04780 [Ancylobacter dichloromethanicus]|uniref:hypothetical protein n=1 Tax=Ancylobacter dichloromethanicus TaxID=518825 RepID=UPI001BCB9F97|nr:hypothetical protein [Ancylobacter dichloromethanicus]MBS7552965.1 hypothetical protein [Ancylobacter dichloromethanicus]